MKKPVLGIMTLYINKQKHIATRGMYEQMTPVANKMGMDLYVFTPADVHPNGKKIYAMVYYAEHKAWRREWRDFPNIIFDRCRIQRNERYEQLLQFRSKYKNLLFLNSPLGNKWDIYNVLCQEKQFHEHLPKSKLFKHSNDVQKILEQMSMIYLKPVNGTGGRGILKIERLHEKQSPTDVVFVQGRDPKGKIIQPKTIPLCELPKIIKEWNSKDKYMIQQGIHIVLPNGKIHDYRMLVQKNERGEWEFTGCAGRIGPKRSVTSNLHGGGTAVSMRHLIKRFIPNEELRNKTMITAKRFGLSVAKFLEKTYGPLCELALDLAIDKKGNVYLLEVNTKPARAIFSRIKDEDTFTRSFTRPVEYALWLYNNHNSIPKEKSFPA